MWVQPSVLGGLWTLCVPSASAARWVEGNRIPNIQPQRAIAESKNFTLDSPVPTAAVRVRGLSITMCAPFQSTSKGTVQDKSLSLSFFVMKAEPSIGCLGFSCQKSCEREKNAGKWRSEAVLARALLWETPKEKSNLSRLWVWMDLVHP